MKSEIGIIGLGVMGKSLSRNLAKNGFQISIYNRHVNGMEENVAVNFKCAYPELKRAQPFDDLKAFVLSIQVPRKILIMVNAGQAVDMVVDEIEEFLEDGDVVIDGGNSHFNDTDRRINSLKKQGIDFIGAGVSGGEEGALNGPSIMPSGGEVAYKKVSKYLETIAAKDSNGNACCTYIGQGGSGHFVKMIHNGIEYVEMQLLAECYAVLKNQKIANDRIADVFELWTEDVGSYLLNITIDILRKKEGDHYLLDLILDKAGNKGTGNWASISIANSGEPATMIPLALLSRYLSFFKNRREETSKIFPSKGTIEKISITQLKAAYQFGRVINHYQGFSIIANASDNYKWQVNLSEVARIWTEGCIIKSDFMKELVEYLKSSQSILHEPNLSKFITNSHGDAQSIVISCLKNEIHIPCLMEAVNFFHGLKTTNSPANLIQAQRDYFGAHTYQRVDDLSGKFYHSIWNI